MSDHIIRKFRFPDYVGMSNEELDRAVEKLQKEIESFDEKKESEKDYAKAMFKAGAIGLKAHYCFTELFKRHGISPELVREWVKEGQSKDLLKNISQN